MRSSRYRLPSRERRERIVNSTPEIYSSQADRIAPSRLRLNVQPQQTAAKTAGSGASISNCILLTGCSMTSRRECKRNSRRKRPRAAIFPVADNRETGVRQLHANLMLAAGQRPHFEQ